MLGDLTGKTALVTGGGSGIGRGIALMLAAQHASVGRDPKCLARRLGPIQMKGEDDWENWMER